jgi:hypothetical protein
MFNRTSHNPDSCSAEELNLRIAIDVDRGSVGVHHFHVSVCGSQSVALYNGHVHDNRLQLAAPIDRRGAVHIRNMRGGHGDILGMHGSVAPNQDCS